MIMNKNDCLLDLTNDLFYKAFNVSPCPMAISDFSSGLYYDVNDSFLKVIGYERNEVIGKTSGELAIWADSEEKEKAKQILLKEEKLRDFRALVRTKSGALKEGFFSAEFITINNKKYMLSLFNDMTVQFNAQNRLFQMLNELPGYVCLRAPDYSIPFANRKFIEIFGSPEGKFCYEIIKNKSKPCETCRSISVFNDHKPIQYQYTCKNNRTYSVYDYPFTDVDGSELVLDFGFDITEIKQMEQEMARLEGLNIIGQMAAVVGHEVRNPITTVRGFLQFFGDKEQYIQHKEHFELMIRELDRANTIITEFLSLSKNKSKDLEHSNLNKIIEDLFPLMQADALNSSKEIVFEPNPIPHLDLNNQEIHQLILNLVRNGLESMDYNGCITIKTYLEEKDVVLSISDQGPGIAQDIIEKLGTPFFTTKEKGTGLGLAVCYSIAERHNATVQVDTSATGTTFYIRFKTTI